MLKLLQLFPYYNSSISLVFSLILCIIINPNIRNKKNIIDINQNNKPNTSLLYRFPKTPPSVIIKADIILRPTLNEFNVSFYFIYFSHN